MSDEVFCFTYDRAEAARVFQEIGTRGLVLAILARIQPETDWEGCLVYKGAAPDDSARTVCIAIRGAAAARVQERIVEVFEATGIPVPAIYEGGPEPQLELARVVGGVWVTP
ncbi:MAG: hypothetical protein MUC56_07405 [Thermoanaerobaculales bacterium]|jgi:hypothetical protein|nr:hypothetical protein [Thermoanaerobaculales bacterium]